MCKFQTCILVQNCNQISVVIFIQQKYPTIDCIYSSILNVILHTNKTIQWQSYKFYWVEVRGPTLWNLLAYLELHFLLRKDIGSWKYDLFIAVSLRLFDVPFMLNIKVEITCLAWLNSDCTKWRSSCLKWNNLPGLIQCLTHGKQIDLI